jgi:hypothetical protein
MRQLSEGGGISLTAALAHLSPFQNAEFGTVGAQIRINKPCLRCLRQPLVPPPIASPALTSNTTIPQNL